MKLLSWKNIRTAVTAITTIFSVVKLVKSIKETKNSKVEASNIDEKPSE